MSDATRDLGDLTSGGRPRPTIRRSSTLVDEWWGGRRMRSLLPRLWFEHFSGTSWIVEDEAAGWPGSSSRSSARTTRHGYVHMIAADPNHRRRGHRAAPCTSGSSRTSPRAAPAASRPSRGRAIARRSRSTGRSASGSTTDPARKPVRHARARRLRRPRRGSRGVHPRPLTAAPEPSADPGNRSRPRGVVGATTSSPRPTCLEEPPMIRRIAATLAATALLLALAVPVLAGGWAEIVADAQTANRPRGQAARGRLPRPPARRDARAVGDRDRPFHEHLDRQDRSTSSRPTTAPMATSWRRRRFPRRATGAGRSRSPNLESEHMPGPDDRVTAGGASSRPIDPTTTCRRSTGRRSDVTCGADEQFHGRSSGSTAWTSLQERGSTPRAPRRQDLTPSATSSRRASPRARGSRRAAPDRGPDPGDPGRRDGRVRDGVARRPGARPKVRGAQPSSARSRPGVTCSWRRRPKRPTRSGASAVSTHRRRAASPSL